MTVNEVIDLWRADIEQGGKYNEYLHGLVGQLLVRVHELENENNALHLEIHAIDSGRKFLEP